MTRPNGSKFRNKFKRRLKVNQMKQTRIILLGALVGATAFAQTTGSITITGSIPDAVSITSVTDAALSTTGILGALTASNNSTLTQIAPVIVRIRSNKQYRLTAVSVFTNSGAGLDDGGQAITAADIGFGITAKDATGSKMAIAHTDVIAGKFDYTTTGFAALAVVDGLTPFVAGTNATLNDIVASTELIHGSRISKLGNLNTQENFLKLTFGAATLPQYFTQNTSFQALVTLTIVTF
jgi:hypothetical protein